MSTISSMTGFARVAGEGEAHAWSWEIRSVNAKGLDVRARLVPGFEALDAKLRVAAGRHLHRGNISLTLSLSGSGDASGFRVNRAVLDQVFEALPEIQARFPAMRPPSADGILGIRGVMEPVSETLDDETRNTLEGLILKSLDEAFMELGEARRREGARLADVLSGQVDEIDRLLAEAKGLAATLPAAISGRLNDQVKALVENISDISEDRLAQEAAILMTKADVREELDRLEAHVAEARTLLATDGAIGRKLDFLCQEFNRESNTLCSKSSDMALTRVALALKTVIDQLREQVQNVE